MKKVVYFGVVVAAISLGITTNSAAVRGQEVQLTDPAAKGTSPPSGKQSATKGNPQRRGADGVGEAEAPIPFPSPTATVEQIETRLRAIEQGIGEIKHSAADLTAAVETHKAAVQRLEEAVVGRSQLSGQCQVARAKMAEAQRRPDMDEDALAVYRMAVRDCQDSLANLVAPILVQARIFALELKEELDKTRRMTEAQTTRLATLVMEQTVLRAMLNVASQTKR